MGVGVRGGGLGVSPAMRTATSVSAISSAPSSRPRPAAWLLVAGAIVLRRLRGTAALVKPPSRGGPWPRSGEVPDEGSQAFAHTHTLSLNACMHGAAASAVPSSPHACDGGGRFGKGTGCCPQLRVKEFAARRLCVVWTLWVGLQYHEGDIV